MNRTKTLLNQMPLFTITREVITEITAKKVARIELVRDSREAGTQKIGFNSRPFILCGLPHRSPRNPTQEYVRRNGGMALSIVAHPKLGLPFGQDRLIPIWVASLAIQQNQRVITFSSAAEILDLFGLPLDGRSYRRLVCGLRRIFGATMYFGPELSPDYEQYARWHFFNNMQLWCNKNPNQLALPHDLANTIELSEHFWNELKDHPIPVDLLAVRALANAPANLDFYMWLTWRCWKATRMQRIPLYGPAGLISQMGAPKYSRPKTFSQCVKKWLRVCRSLWPACPAALSDDGNWLIINGGQAINGYTKRRLPVSEIALPLFTESALNT